MVQDESHFLYLSLAVRCVAGTGESAIWTVGYLIGARLYPDNVATAYVRLKYTTYNLALIIQHVYYL